MSEHAGSAQADDNTDGTDGAVRGDWFQRLVDQLDDPFRTLVDYQLDLTCIYGIDGRLFYVNRAYASFFGREASDLVGTCIVDLAPEQARASARDNLETSVAAFRESESKTVNEFGLRDATGALRWLEFSDQPVYADEGHLLCILSSGRDVSSRHETNQRLIEMNQKLADSNRDLQDFAYVASHDLQEPLRKIIAFSNRLNDKAAPELSEKNLDYLNRISGAAGRMQNLIDDLLEVSRVSTRGGSLVPVDLHDVLRDVLSDLEIAVEREGATVIVPANLPKVPADESQMRQLFQNLIGNALKFRHADSAPVVTLTVDDVASGDHPSALKSQRESSFVRIRVSDNGIGFDEKFATKIFTIFHRLHGRTEYEGSGIGLSVCKKIIERHNGLITAQSEPGAGATFELLLPVA